ncbi:adenosine deaminase [Paraglaciecola aquimarina]|uniref:Adenine deaminase n=1 Tax=Paraglaciecola aquimarina TaxID=1235557 RepID=A0ABU3SYR5_9ALTE|nr:adenosine deaminase [Paraglaciecola aquimarina]MDU0355148.1 adenosine deaminase [Paraglaciecola aquimarina]
MTKLQMMQWLDCQPKVELHLHIEGTLEPEFMMSLAKKHQVNLPCTTMQEVKEAYNFNNLQSFLDLYYLGASVLRDEEDFYQLMWRYLLKCKEQNIVHCELMFDPQTHTERGVEFAVFMTGFKRAIAQAKKEWGQSCYLIMSFLRHLSEDSAIQTLQQAQPFYDDFIAVGLDSGELGNPPEKFQRVFQQAKELGFKRVAHAGEEGPPEYIWSAIKTLDVARVDHGVRSIEDEKLIDFLIESQLPLTVCPLSNIKLKVFSDMQQHNILQLLERGLLVTVNADDPSYFGGYLNENFYSLIDSLSIQQTHLRQLVRNGFIASFLPQEIKEYWLRQLD